MSYEKEPVTFDMEATSDDYAGGELTRDGFMGLTASPGCTVRISNPAKESGYPIEPGPLDWLNSARITTDPDDDAVHCLVSVGDPRGAFCFTVRRLSDGRLVIHTPYPGEGVAHVETKEIRPGTLLVKGDFSSDTEEE